MTTKKWLTLFFTCFFLIVGVIGIFNYIIDPFNIFSHKNRCNTLAVGFNERLQKSAYLKYNSAQNYNAILLGSSRATYYSFKAFNKLLLYNFSFSGAMPIEYNSYLEYAKKHNHKQFSTIVLALDFYTFNRDYQGENMVELGNKFLFFLNNYFSLDTMKYSIINCKRSLLHTTSHRSYNRENIVFSDKVQNEKVQLLAKVRSKTYYNSFKNYDKNYTIILNNLKKNNKTSNFIIYTPPLSKEFLEVIYKDKKLLNFYYLWLNQLVDIFGNIYCFTIQSELSEHYEKYSLDGDHYYPQISSIIVKILMKEKKIDGYGILLNQENIKQFIQKGVVK
jgi:hypothetical protein